MSKVKVDSWRTLRERYGTPTPEGWILPIHLCTGQLEPKVRFHRAQASPYPSGAHIIPIITIGNEGIDNVQELN